MGRFFLFFYLFILVSCSKERLPDPINIGEPSVRLSYDINGSTYEISSENYFLYTDYNLDPDGFFCLTGEYIESNCDTGCGPSIKLIFYDLILNRDLGFNIDAVIEERSYEYSYEQELPLYHVSLFPNFGVIPPLNWCWSYGSNMIDCNTNRTEIMAYPGETLSMQMSYPGVEVSFNAILDDGSQLLTPSICMDRAGDDLSILIGNVFGDYRLEWFTSGSTEPFNQGDSILVDKDIFDLGPIQLVIYDGGEALYFVDLILDPTIFENDLCINGFSSEIIVENTPIELQRVGHVEINYTDGNGAVFSSATNSLNSQLGFMNVSNITEGLSNERNQKVRRFDINFKAYLLNDQGDQIIIENAQGEFVVAYPN